MAKLPELDLSEFGGAPTGKLPELDLSEFETNSANNWDEVKATPEYKAAGSDAREVMRDNFFVSNVMPSTKTEDLQAARDQFDSDTKPTIAGRVIEAVGNGIKFTKEVYDDAQKRKADMIKQEGYDRANKVKWETDSGRIGSVDPKEEQRKIDSIEAIKKYESSPVEAVSEIVKQGYGGLTIDAPAAVNKAGQAFSPDGSAAEDFFKQGANYWESNKADFIPNTRNKGVITNAFASSARAIPLSNAAMAAAGTSLLTSSVAAPIATAAGIVALFGGSQFTDTYEKGVAAGLPKDQAFKAGLLTGGIEGLGETLGDFAGGKFLTGLGRAFAQKLGTKEALTAATSPRWAAKFGKDFLENMAVQAGTEYGQGFGETAVENRYGISNESPIDQANQGAITAAAMSFLMAGGAIHGHSQQAEVRKLAGDLLEDPAAPIEQRAKAAEFVRKEMEQHIGAEAAKQWHEGMVATMGFDKVQNPTPENVPQGTMQASDILGTPEQAPDLYPGAAPGSLSSAANIAAKQGIAPAQHPSDISAADFLGTPEPEANNDQLQLGATNEQSDSLPSSTDAQLTEGLPTGSVAADVATSPAVTPQQPATPIPTASAATVPVTDNYDATSPAVTPQAGDAAVAPVAAEASVDTNQIKQSIEQLIKRRKIAGQFGLAPQLDAAITKAKSAIKLGTGKAADFTKLSKLFKGKDGEIHTTLLSIANALQSSKPAAKKAQKPSGDLIQRIKQLTENRGISSEYAEDFGAKDAKFNIKMAFREGGDSPDFIARQLKDEGYPLSEDDLIGGLSAMVRDYVGGQRNFRHVDTEDAAMTAHDDKAFLELIPDAEKYGIDWRKFKKPDDLYIEITKAEDAKNDAEEDAHDIAFGDDEINLDNLPESTASEVAIWLGEDNARGHTEKTTGAATGEQDQGGQYAAQNAVIPGEAKGFALQGQTNAEIAADEQARRNEIDADVRASGEAARAKHKLEEAAQTKASVESGAAAAAFSLTQTEPVSKVDQKKADKAKAKSELQGQVDIFAQEAQKEEIVNRRGETESQRRARYNRMSRAEMEDDMKRADERERRAHDRERTSYLTGLPNRVAFDESTPMAVTASADIDGMKTVNDTLGHAAGDSLIKANADALRAAVLDNPGVKVYHQSGDEFIAQANTIEEIDRAMKQAQKILSEKGFEYKDKDGNVQTKKGIGFSYGTGSTYAEADGRLDADKKSRKAAGLRTGERDTAVRQAEKHGPGKSNAGNDTGTAKAVSDQGTNENASVEPAPSSYSNSDILKREDAAKAAETAKITPEPRQTSAIISTADIPRALKIPDPATGEGQYSAREAMDIANKQVEKLEALKRCLA